MNHLTHVSYSESITIHRQNDSFPHILSHFVRVVTRYGSNESDDSLRVFCVYMDLFNYFKSGVTNIKVNIFKVMPLALVKNGKKM